MAAFEAISELKVHPIGLDASSEIDLRTCELPCVTPDDDGFDPRDHRAPKQPIATWMAYFNIVRAGFGPPMLAIPLVISQSGVILGPILIISMGLLIIHTHRVLLWCMNEVSRQLRVHRIPYRYAFRLSLLRGPPCFHWLGRNGLAIIAICMLFSQIGICCVFYIFTSDGLRDIFDMQGAQNAQLALLIPYIVLEIVIKNLIAASYVALFATFLNFTGVVMVLYLMINKEPTGVVRNIKISVAELTFCLGTMIFNTSVIGITLAIDKAIKDPRIVTKPYGALEIGTMIPCLFGCIFGCVGYYSFGTMNENILRSLQFDDLVTMIAVSIYTLSVIMTYPLQCLPGINIVLDIIKNHDPNYTPSSAKLDAIYFIARPLFVLVTFGISSFAPYQSAFVAVAGNLVTTLLSIIFPAMMEICLLYPFDYGRRDWILLKDIILIIFGFFCFVFGTYHNGKIIYLRILESDGPEPLNVKDYQPPDPDYYNNWF